MPVRMTVKAEMSLFFCSGRAGLQSSQKKGGSQIVCVLYLDREELSVCLSEDTANCRKIAGSCECFERGRGVLIYANGKRGKLYNYV